MATVQRYVSSELTHFVGRYLRDEEGTLEEIEARQFELLVAILKSGRLRNNRPRGYGVSFDEASSGNMIIDRSAPISTMFIPQMVCFCDIPVADFTIHMGKYSRFGLAFPRDFLVQRGAANPVFYIAANQRLKIRRRLTPLPPPVNLSAEALQHFEEQLADYAKAQEELAQNPDRDVTLEARFTEMLQLYHSLLDLMRDVIAQQSSGPGLSEEQLQLMDLEFFLDSRVFGYIKPFDASLPEDHPENYYMEREWRVVNHVDFALTDVARVIFPQAFAAQFRSQLPAFVGQIHFADG